MHFDKPGKENTEATLTAAYERAKELSIKEIALATTTGETAEKALSICKGMTIVAVSYHAGFKEPFQLTLTDDVRAELELQGVKVVCATHALSGIERGLAKQLPGVYPALLVAQTLKLFGQGVKVAVEIAVMAADAGALTGNPIVAIGGSGKGADAALVLTPSNMNNFLEMQIHEVLCKPNLYAG